MIRKILNFLKKEKYIQRNFVQKKYTWISHIWKNFVLTPLIPTNPIICILHKYEKQ